jgi:hypothetical protein
MKLGIININEQELKALKAYARELPGISNVALEKAIKTKILEPISKSISPSPGGRGWRGRGKIRQDKLLIFLVSLFTPTPTLGFGILRRSTACIRAGVPRQGGGSLILR